MPTLDFDEIIQRIQDVIADLQYVARHLVDDPKMLQDLVTASYDLQAIYDEAQEPRYYTGKED